MHTDWQTLSTLAMGVLALAYLVRRWWPGVRGLWSAAAPVPAARTACQSGPQADAHGEVQAPAASCGSGCGQCGSAATPAKDHRVQIVRQRP